MKKVHILDVIDNLLWIFLAILPVICYLVYSSNDVVSSTALLSFSDYVSEKLGFFVPWSNVITETFTGVFGQNGVFPILSDNVVMFLTYFCVIELAHLVVDVLLFLPRLFHGWMDHFARR